MLVGTVCVGVRTKLKWVNVRIRNMRSGGTRLTVLCFGAARGKTGERHCFGVDQRMLGEACWWFEDICCVKLGMVYSLVVLAMQEMYEGW